MEEWKDIPNADGYQVSTMGEIRSLDRQIRPGRWGKGHRIRKGQPIMPSRDKDGYLQVSLSANHPKNVSRKVHRIVMMTFIGDSLLSVNHKDGDKSNNRLDNLEYVTHSQNHIHARSVLKKLIGDKHWNFRGITSEENIFEIRRYWKTGITTRSQLARIYTCSPQTIWEITKAL